MKGNLGTLQMMFKQMNEDGWDTNKPLKWGFFFLDYDKSKLQAVYNELKDHSYVLEEISLKDEEKWWQMYVTKEEILMPEKLHKRNLAFNDLAEYHEIEVYDGWDVSKVEN